MRAGRVWVRRPSAQDRAPIGPWRACCVLTRRPCASQELAAVDNQIKEKRAQIRFSKAALVNNDAAIQRLLQQVVMTR